MKRILCVLLLAFLLCGCAGYRETDSEYFVTAVCFEKEEKDFKAYIEVLSIGEDDKKPESRVFTALGKTPYSAVFSTASLMPKNAVFDHCGTAVIHENIKAEDFKNVMEYLYDAKNLNLGIFMFVTEDIGSVLDCNSQSPSVGYDIMATEENVVKTSGISFKNKYYEIRARAIATGGFCLPFVSVKKDRPEIEGEIIYADYLPTAQLNRNEAQFFNLIYSGSSGGEISVSGHRCRVNGISSKIKQVGNMLKAELDCNYRFPSDNKSSKLKKEISELIQSLYGNKALNVLGIENYELINGAEVTVSGK